MTKTILPGNYINNTDTTQPMELYPGLILDYLETTVSLNTAAANFTVGTIPSGAIVLAAQFKPAGTISATTAVKIGLGISGTITKYGLSAGLTAIETGALRDLATAGTPLGSTETIKLYACATDGTAAGTIGGTGQEITVRMTYLKLKPLD
jgi:hypothetical protein